MNRLPVVHQLRKLLLGLLGLLWLLGMLRLLGMLAWWGGMGGWGVWLRWPERCDFLAILIFPRWPLPGSRPSCLVPVSLPRSLPLPVLLGLGCPPRSGTGRLRLAVITLTSVHTPLPPADLWGQHRLPALQQALRVRLLLQRLPGLQSGLPVGCKDLVRTDPPPGLHLWRTWQPGGGVGRHWVSMVHRLSRF